MGRYLSIVILLVLALAAAWYWSVQRDQREISEATVLPPVEPSPEPDEPEIRYPIENIPRPTPEPTGAEVEPEPPLPPLTESDEEVLDEAEALVGPDPVEQYVVQEMVVSRLVATVDSLTSARVAPIMLPFQSVPGRFQVIGEGDELAISPGNAERYQPYVDLLLEADTDRVLALYRRYYPLFQEAYRGLGYPDAYFNDRLVSVIDHLLQTPEPRGVLELRQNEAVYEFKDEALESLSAGQKMLLRLGYENQRAVKERLREFRAALASAPPGTPSEPLGD